MIAFFSFKLIVAASFILDSVCDLESQPDFIAAGRLFSYLFIFWAIPAKIQIGGIEGMYFPEVLKKEHVKIPGIDQKKVEFPGVLKKISYRISMGLGF